MSSPWEPVSQCRTQTKTLTRPIFIEPLHKNNGRTLQKCSAVLGFLIEFYIYDLRYSVALLTRVFGCQGTNTK
jgi:hypothetical protein